MYLTSRSNNEYSGVAFLDRDGVIIKERNYINNPKDVDLNPGIKKVLKLLKDANYKIIVITNQSGIYRGYFKWKHYLEVSNQMLKLLGDHAHIDEIYACGNSDAQQCKWRKPGTQMILQGWSKKLLNEKKSILIGDKASDIEAGDAANIRFLFHVLTGHGEVEKDKVKKLMIGSEYNFGPDAKKNISFFQPVNLDALFDYLMPIIQN
tara:strand:- start:437 stop:1057 length:621 start_codon:yes stop_codon:yes gene_type:complete